MSTERRSSGVPAKSVRFMSKNMKKIYNDASRSNHRQGSSSSTQSSINSFITRDSVKAIKNVLGGNSSEGRRTIGRKNKRGSDSDEEKLGTPKNVKKQPKAVSTESVAKQMLETGQSLKKLSKYNNSSGLEIAESLGDLESSDEENELTEAGSRVDAFLESSQVKRFCAENELRISFQCPLYEQIGTLNQVFRLNKPEELPDESSDEENEGSRLFESIFFARQNSKWRKTLIEQIKPLSSENGIRMHFNQFMVLFCYVFQLQPNQIGVALDGYENMEEWQKNKLDKMATKLEAFKVNVEETKRDIISKNIDLFLDIWNNFDFKKWKKAKILALLRALCFIYLDRDMVDDREKIQSTIAYVLDQVVGDETENQTQKLDNILFQFGHRGILQSAERDLSRVIVLFNLFSKFVQFKSHHKLSTVYGLLQYVISQEIDTENPPPRDCTLGDVFQLFPKAIECLKERNNATELHCIYTKLMDELTLDGKMLNEQVDESLEEARENFNEACSSLNKRDINQKMVDMWSESAHRIRKIIQNRRNAKTLERETPNKYYGGGLGSSSDEDE